MKILVVDDSETLRVQLKQDLEKGGFQVVEGVDGVNGIEVLEKNKDVALIVCDVNMPNMDGLTMCSKVHQTAEFKAIPIFMLTTESGPEMKAKGKEAGVIAWITKPYVAEKMLAAIGKVLKKT
ncbi:response regulator [bacterium]|jgi:two-component system chemotaxis response regulator CheY|nr:response regulator [bacterium]